MSTSPSVSVSIIVTCHAAGQSRLRQMLHGLLSLQYNGEYEVIIVQESRDRDFEEWLEDVKTSHPNLHHTFCPTSARGINPRMLALTLGAKAAAYGWLLLLSADMCHFDTVGWMDSLTVLCNDHTDIIIGTKGHKRLWSRMTFGILRRKFSVFRPTSSIILCRRSIPLTPNFRPAKGRMVRHYL